MGMSETDQEEEKEDQEEKKQDTLFGFFIPATGSLCLGAGTIAQWKLAVLSTVSESPWLGSALMGLVATVVIIYLLVTLRPWRLWGIVALGFLLDCVLTIVLMWPIGGLAVADPLSLWPYLLGTAATLLTGIIIGLVAPKKAMLRCAVGIASVDFALAGVSGLAAPSPATWALISRIAAGYCAVGMGVVLAGYVRSALKSRKKRKAFRKALKQLLTVILIECVAATVAGVAVALVL